MTDSAQGLTDTSDMAAVHKVFRGSLASAPTFVGSAAGDDARRAMIANYYTNFVMFLEVHHDGEEQIVFPRLTERAPNERAIVEHAESQHHEVIGLVDNVKNSIGFWEEKGDPAADGLVSSLQALGDVLIPHLDQEEAEIVPLASKFISAEEWGMLPGHALGGFGGDKVWLIMGLIRENFTQEQRDTMLAHMPPPARQMWESMGEASFNELIAQVRQTA